MTTPNIADLKSAFFGTTDGEYEFLEQAAAYGMTASGMLASVTGQVYGKVPAVGDWFTNVHFSRSTLASTKDRAMFSPLIVPRNMTLNAIGAELVTISANSTLRLGIYTSSATTGLPDALVVDAGTVDGTATPAAKTIAIDVTLTAGLYWACSVGQGSAGNATWRTTNAAPILPNSTGFTALGFANNAYYVSGVTGALPATSGVDGSLVAPLAAVVAVRRSA